VRSAGGQARRAKAARLPDWRGAFSKKLAHKPETTLPVFRHSNEPLLRCESVSPLLPGMPGRRCELTTLCVDEAAIT
jgi:hypothetical protein